MADPARERRTRGQRWSAPGATLLAGAGCALVAGLRLGGTGVLSAALAALVVVTFFSTGLLPLVLAPGRPGRAAGALLVLLGGYVARLVLVLVALTAAARAGAVEPAAVGLSLVACALAWTVAQAVVLVRTPG